MSQVEVERFLGRLITDVDFRGRAAKSLKAACFSEGIVLSPEEMSFLCHFDVALFGLLAERLDDAIKRN